MVERAYETREATHGNSWGAFTAIKKATSGGGLDPAIVPTVFTGLRAVSFDTTQDTGTFYADNMIHIKIRGNKSIEGSITAYQLPEKFLLEHLGYKKTDNGGLTDTGSAVNFVWQYVETVTDEFGAEFDQLTVYYNCMASAPTAASATDEDAVEPKEFEIPLVASPNPLVLDKDNKPVTFMQIRIDETNKALLDLAYTQVILPTTASPAA